MDLGVQLYGCMPLYNRNADMLLDTLARGGCRRAEPCLLFGDYHAFDAALLPHLWHETELDQHWARLDRRDMTMPSCHLFTDNITAALPHLLAVAKHYGIASYVVGCPAPYTASALETVAQTYMRAADALSEQGVALWIHNGSGEVRAQIEGMSALEWLVRACTGKVGLQVDTGWAANGGANVGAFLTRNESFVRSVHHKDLAALCDSPVNVAIGTGVVDPRAAFAFSYTRNLPQLVDQDTSPTDLLADTVAGLHFLNKLEAAGV